MFLRRLEQSILLKRYSFIGLLDGGFYFYDTTGKQVCIIVGRESPVTRRLGCGRTRASTERTRPPYGCSAHCLDLHRSFGLKEQFSMTTDVHSS